MNILKSGVIHYENDGNPNVSAKASGAQQGELNSNSRHRDRFSSHKSLFFYILFKCHSYVTSKLVQK